MGHGVHRMPRQKEYDRDRVVEKAMKTFWEKGYEGTSVQDLVNATGLNRFGMYQAFGSKEGLFLEALDMYRNNVSSQMIRILEEGPPGRATLQDFFHNLIEKYTRPEKTRGCFITNTAIESRLRGKDAQVRVNKHFRRIERGLRRCLEGARENKEINGAGDLDKLSRYLLGVTQGLAVFGRTLTDERTMENMVEVALGHLFLSHKGPSSL